MNKLLVYILGTIIVGAGIATGVAAVASSANANGIVVRQSELNFWAPITDTRRIEVFVNQPTHNAPANTYNKSNVPFSYRVVWGVCANVPTSVRVISRYAKSGGLFTNVHGDENTEWAPIGNETYTATATCGQHGCLVSRSSSTRGVNMSDVQGNNTTLQVIAKWHNTAVPDSSIPENPDIAASYYAHTVVNIHLLWAQVATPTPTATPTVRPTATPTPTTTPVPAFSCVPGSQTVEVNKWIGVYENPSGGIFTAKWNAPGAEVVTHTGTGFSTWYKTPGDKVITATSVGFPGATKTATCKVKVVAAPVVTPTPTPGNDPEHTPTPSPVTEITCIQAGKEVVIKSPNANINCNNIQNVVNVTVENSSNNSSNNSSSNNNTVKVVTKVNNVPVPTPKPVAVPVTAKTGPTEVAMVALLTIGLGAGLAYFMRKSAGINS
jgi:hypothetical protein